MFLFYIEVLKLTDEFPVKILATSRLNTDAHLQIGRICVNVCFISIELSAGVEVGKPTHFTIYTKGAGKAQPEVQFSAAAKGEAVRDFEIIDNHDYSYTVRYTAVQQVRGRRFGLLDSSCGS